MYCVLFKTTCTHTAKVQDKYLAKSCWRRFQKVVLFWLRRVCREIVRYFDIIIEFKCCMKQQKLVTKLMNANELFHQRTRSVAKIYDLISWVQTMYNYPVLMDFERTKVRCYHVTWFFVHDFFKSFLVFVESVAPLIELGILTSGNSWGISLLLCYYHVTLIK